MDAMDKAISALSFIFGSFVALVTAGFGANLFWVAASFIFGFFVALAVALNAMKDKR